MAQPAKTANVLIVSLSVLAAFATLVIAILIGNTQAAQEQTKQVRACASAGNQWVSGNCIHTKP